MKKAKFEIRDLMPIAMTLIVAGIGIAYGLQIMGDMKPDMCETDYTYSPILNGCAKCSLVDPTKATFNVSDGTCYNSSGITEAANVTGNTFEFNATKDALSGVAKLPAKLPMIVTVIVAAVIIGILIKYLMFR